VSKTEVPEHLIRISAERHLMKSPLSLVFI
jgi:hypothetical protein